MMKKLIVSSIFMLTLIANAPTQAQQTLTIMAEQLPPFNFEDAGQVRGISTDVLLRLMEKVGQPLERSAISIVPWARGYDAVQNTPGSVLFSMARTEEREPLFKWVGPITNLTLGLIAPKAKQIVINTLEDAKQYKIGSIRDGAPEQLVIKGGIDPNTLDRITDPVLNVKKLAAGRIDLFAFNVPTTFYLMLKEGLKPDDYDVVYTLKETGLYFAFHKDTDAALIASLNAALEELKKPDASGKSELDAIVAEYLGAK